MYKSGLNFFKREPFYITPELLEYELITTKDDFTN